MLDPLRIIWHKKSWGSNTIQDHMKQDNLWTIQHKNPHEPYYAWTLEDHTTLVPWRTMQWMNTWGPYYTRTIQHHTTHEPSRTILVCKNHLRPTDTRALQDYSMHEPSRTMRCKNPWPKKHVKVPWLAFNAKNLKDHATQEPLETIQQKIPYEQHNTNILEDLKDQTTQDPWD
jgi:hypothetical protein